MGSSTGSSLQLIGGAVPAVKMVTGAGIVEYLVR